MTRFRIEIFGICHRSYFWTRAEQECRIGTASRGFLNSIVDPGYPSCLSEHPESFSQPPSQATGRVRYESLGALEGVTPEQCNDIWTAIYAQDGVLAC
jgi:hypothetical protein